MRFFRRYKTITLLLTCVLSFFVVRNLLKKEKYSLPANIDPTVVHTLEKLEISYDTFLLRKKRFDDYQISEPTRTGPGEKGADVFLTAEERVGYEEMFKRETFNKFASDKISLERSLKDQRPRECTLLKYPKQLPTASVIIIFHNEDWGALLRTAHSVINRSPPEYLKEVILLDDANYKEILGKPLEEYVTKQWPDGVVKIERRSERLGLVRARSEGARAATGDVILFLDSHCEATKGWLEPVLARINENRTTVICPTIDSIGSDSLGYSGSSSVLSVGSFWWSMFFTWVSVPDRERKRVKSPADPVRSATMAGGLFAMDRKYFFELGGYDDGMGIWGGENLEISFRVWMCGGSMEFHPCSHVGHIFRAGHPYTFPGNKDYNGINTKRLAEVWLDEYKRVFYMFRPDLVTLDVGDYSSRIELRKRLKCKSFKWFLENIEPDKYIVDENVTGYGMFSNPSSNLCLDFMNSNEFDRMTVPANLYPCQGGKSTQQIFSLSPKGEIRREWACLTVIKDKFQYMTCSEYYAGDQIWTVEKSTGLVKLKSTSMCLEAVPNGEVKMKMNVCESSSPYQKWTLEHYL